MGLFGSSFELIDDDLLTVIKALLKDAESRQTVYLISPYWQMNANLRSAIKDAVTDGVRVKCIMRANEKLTGEDIEFFRNNRVEIRGLPHLHAKLYLNDSEALVTSLNLYNYSDKESIELGVIVSGKSELSFLKEKAEKWWDEAKPVTFDTMTTTKSKPAIGSTISAQGFCVRCGKPKSLNPKYPHCDDCFKKWAEYENPTYPEKYCHKCGASFKTSKKDPLCKPCWSATNK